MRVPVSVTADDIVAGHPRNCRDCPIASAVRRVCGDGCCCRVVLKTVTIWHQAHGPIRIPLPPEATTFIRVFDGLVDAVCGVLGLPPATPQPFTFDLDIPAEYLRKGSAC